MIATPPAGKHTANPKSPLFKKVAKRGHSRTQPDTEKFQHLQIQDVDAFLAFLSNRFLEDISRDDIKRFKDKFIEEGKVPHTINGYLGKLQFLFGVRHQEQVSEGREPSGKLPDSPLQRSS